MADQNFIKNHEFLIDNFDDVLQQDEIEPQYQNIEPAQGIGMNNYGHNMMYMERPKNMSIVENIHMQQAHKTVLDYSDDEDQDNNYRVIKNMTIHYQTQHDQDHIEEQWNAQNENQVDEFQDEIKFQIIHSGDGNMTKINDGTGSAETMLNKYAHTPSNSGFSASNNSQTKEQQNGNNIPPTNGKTMMGSSILAGIGTPIDQNGATNQQQNIQNQQKQVVSSQSLQGGKQGFKIINKEKSNLLSSSSILQPKSLTNIDSQQIGGGNIVNSNNNSMFLQQIPQQNLNNSDFRSSLINNNNLASSINNGLDNSLLLQSMNNGLALRNPAQNMNYQENNAYFNKMGFKQNQNYLGSSLINHQQDQILQDSQQFTQQDQQQQQLQQQNDTHILNKVKSEDCSSTNEQPIANNSVVNTNNNNNSTVTAPLNGNINNIQASPLVPNQMIAQPHQTPPQGHNNNSGHISNKQMKGSNVSTAEIKKPIKKVEVVMNNQNQMGMIHNQQHQQQQMLSAPPPPPQQIHPQFQQNFLGQIPNGLSYPNPNQPPPQPQQQQYGYPYSQPPQGQPQPQYGQQQPPKGFLPPHYGANPHLPAQYNSYLDQPHQQNLLAPALQNPYSQELDYLPYGQFLQPQPGAPQQPPPPQPQNPGYGDYMQPGFNGMPYNAYNNAYTQHQTTQAHQNAVAAVHQQHHLFPHLPPINQNNGFNPAFPLGLRSAAPNLAGSNHEMNASPFNAVQNQQNAQISQFKIKEEAQPKGVEDKNSSSSQNNNVYPNGSMVPQQNLNSSNQMTTALNGQQNQNPIQNSYLIQNPSQYAQMMIPKQGQPLLYQDGMNPQGVITDPLHQANNALKLAQGQQFLNNQISQFNQQHQQQQQQQFLKQNQIFQQQQQQQQLKQQQQARMMTNNNLEEESRDAEEEDEENANSDGNGELEGNTNGKPKRPKNETKNIPKNYAKAFLRYIIDKDRVEEMKKILKQIDTSLEYDDIKKEAKNFKKNMNAIKDVRKIWQDDTNDRTRSISKFMRIASHQFLQKEAISYIFSSNKIKNSKSHIIYRHVMGLAMADPEKFNNIKSLYKNAYMD